MKPGFPTPIPFAQLQSLDRPDFVALLSTVVEHSPWVAEQTWQRRPFASWTALFLALEQTLREAEPAQQLALLQAHPELAGREAQAGSMTSDSQSEQGRLGLLSLQPHELERLAALNPTIEIVTRNELTAILETEREQWGEAVQAAIGGPSFQRRPELLGITLLLVAGVQYLLVRSRTIRIFGGLDLRSDAGWAALKQSLRAMSAALLADAPPAPKVQPAKRAAAASKDARKLR